MAARVRQASLLIAALLAISSCSRAEELDPVTMDREEVAITFAEAFVGHKIDVMRDLTCPEVPEPRKEDASVHVKAEVSGEPTTEEPTGGLVAVFEPAPDFFVPYEAQVEGTTTRGYVVISLESTNCVSSWGDSRVF